MKKFKVIDYVVFAVAIYLGINAGEAIYAWAVTQ